MCISDSYSRLWFQKNNKIMSQKKKKNNWIMRKITQYYLIKDKWRIGLFEKETQMNLRSQFIKVISVKWNW